MAQISGIYKIVNRLNGKVYVGRSVDIYARWGQHIRSALGNSPDPIHCAIRKYGAENFDFVVLAQLADNLPDAERNQIAVYDSYSSAKGYNIGGTAGGWPTKSDLCAMDYVRRNKWLSHFQSSAKKGIASLKRKRTDAAYEAEYLQKMSAVGAKRERNIAARRGVDAEYDQKMHALRSQATAARTEGYQKQAGIAFKEKFSADAAYRARISANRKAANLKSVIARRESVWFDISVACYMRKTGHSLQEIANETGNSVAWASKAARGV